MPCIQCNVLHEPFCHEASGRKHQGFRVRCTSSSSTSPPPSFLISAVKSSYASSTKPKLIVKSVRSPPLPSVSVASSQVHMFSTHLLLVLTTIIQIQICWCPFVGVRVNSQRFIRKTHLKNLMIKLIPKLTSGDTGRGKSPLGNRSGRQ